MKLILERKVWGVTQCVSAAGKSRTVESMASEGMGPDSPMLLLLTVWKRLAWLLRIPAFESRQRHQV